MTEPLHIIQLGIGIIFLWVLYFFLWRDYRTDKLRFDLFVARDSLFDVWKKEGLDFNHPAYTTVRESMNGLIRYAHRVTFFGIFVPTLLAPKKSAAAATRNYAQLKEDAKSLPSEAQSTVMEAYFIMLFLAVRHVILGAPILLAVVLAITAYYGTKKLVLSGLAGAWDVLRVPLYALADRFAIATPQVNTIPWEGRLWFQADKP